MKAVDGVDLQLRSGEILGLIGPNGAGKTTLVNALTGFQRPTAGSVHLDGVEVAGWPPIGLRAADSPEPSRAVRLFAGLTVFENVELGAVGVGNDPQGRAAVGLGVAGASRPNGHGRRAGVGCAPEWSGAWPS